MQYTHFVGNISTQVIAHLHYSTLNSISSVHVVFKEHKKSTIIL